MSAYMVDLDTLNLLVQAAGRHRGHDGYGMSWYAEEPHEIWKRAETGEEGMQLLQAARREVSQHRPDTMHAAVALLFAQNLVSIYARYPDCAENPANMPGPVALGERLAAEPEWLPSYERVARELPPPAWILKSLSCYEYQACEGEQWHGSSAKRFCDALRAKLVSMLPGYKSAPWGWTRENARAVA